MYLLLERGEWSQGEREEENRERKHQCARETWISCTSLPPAGDLVHNLGTCPTTWVLVPTGNQTADFLVHRPVLSPLRHTSHAMDLFIFVRYDNTEIKVV